MVLRHLVVDGSNIATEGRELPSLVQLDEAVQAFIREFGPQIVTVVVDASFPNRIARNERKVYEDAVVAGEIITPPAGAIGRGDAFILQIADRAGGTILSNDSFQEFHGQYDWLFEPGRLVGGKPVPHVGWVFIDRTPVRGPTSRRAVSLAKQAAAQPAPPKARASRAKKAAPGAEAPPAAPAAKSGRAAKGGRGAQNDQTEKDETTGKAGKAGKADRAAKGGRAAKAPKSDAPAPAAPPQPAREGSPAKRSVTTRDNEALPFIEFVGAHAVGTQVEGVVEQFSSHGAYVQVDGVLAYAPLKYLADPAPRSAKQVLRIGETRSFVVVSVEPGRRGIDLALPGVPLDGSSAAASVEPPAPAESGSSRRGRSSRKPADAASPPAESTPAAAPAPAESGSSRRGRSSRKPAAAAAPAVAETAPAAETDEAAPAKGGRASKAAKGLAKAAKSAAKKATGRKAAGRKAAASPTAGAAGATPGAAAPVAKKASRAKKAAATKNVARSAAGGRAAGQ
ncbi:MAG TPA: S1 RNA-binding domain-containing protein [Acidimicrobiales bacterium]|nr:S1 RNA-binding domain-containing protein [Acidimicrobiales bacterium]